MRNGKLGLGRRNDRVGAATFGLHGRETLGRGRDRFSPYKHLGSPLMGNSGQTESMRKACFAPKPVNDNSSVKLESTLQTSMLRQSSFDPPCWPLENLLIMTSFAEKYLKGN